MCKILNISIFDGAWNHTKPIFSFLKFERFQMFELYWFWDSVAIGKYNAPCASQTISFEEKIMIQYKQNIVPESFIMFIVS